GIFGKVVLPQIRLDGTGYARAVVGTFVVDGHVPDLARAARGAAEDLVVVDDRAAHARAQRHHDERVVRTPRPVVRRAEPGHVGIVLHDDWHRGPEALLDGVLQVDRLPA